MTRRDYIGLLAAPAPQLLLTCAVTVEPAFGWRDALLGILIAFGTSYGVMGLVGLPAHIYLRRRGRTSLTTYIATSLTMVALLYLGWALVEGNPVPSPNDSPFGPVSLFSGLSLLLIGVPAVIFATSTSGLFWLIAVRRAGA